MITFTVYGKAEPAGSKRAFVNKKTQRAQVVDANKNSKPWQAEVKAAAIEAMESQVYGGLKAVLDGPLSLSLFIYVQRPKGHYGAKGLKENAPGHPTVRPDLTKLIRGIEDALTGIVWRDDAQVVYQTATKLYTDFSKPRAVISVKPVKR